MAHLCNFTVLKNSATYVNTRVMVLLELLLIRLRYLLLGYGGNWTTNWLSMYSVL